MKAAVIMNTQHSFMPEQEVLLNKTFPEGWGILEVPAKGWDKMEMDSIYTDLKGPVVFLSPIPLLLGWLVSDRAERMGGGYACRTQVYLFHNDHREKKELPNGKVISITAKEGWELIEV